MHQSLNYIALALLLAVPQTLAHTSRATAAGYTLKNSYEGETFFDGFTFFIYDDPTAYVDKATAFSKGLAGYDSGTPYIQFDNWSQLSATGDGKRDSVRIQSDDSWNGGVLTFDVAQMPYGLGTWPAFWTNGPDWPNGGELDIIEGINNDTYNHVTIHTYDGCTQSGTAAAIGEYSSETHDCSGFTPTNSGCGFEDPNPNSYGEGLNNGGGGVFATEWDVDAGTLKTWFFPRLLIPQDILNNSPNPQNWGQPVSHFVSDSCDLSTFTNHSIILNTTLCGYYAGNNFPNGGLEACNEFIRDPSNLPNNKWVVNSIRVYE
ncbi:hypothetical protein E3P84_00981 [Wallemia ichthyophaga]|nr:hypothetical protein E3P84_00981 [Wallemia ichthyophaga]TIB42744.1 hypothetical protein E3P83_01026 [Wallemia ichthyophaga]